MFHSHSTIANSRFIVQRAHGGRLDNDDNERHANTLLGQKHSIELKLDQQRGRQKIAALLNAHELTL